MIRDVAKFQRTGVARRRVRKLDNPVTVWRVAMYRVTHQDRGRVRTFAVPPAAIQGDDRQCGPVLAIRVEPPPDRLAVPGRHVRWWRVEEISMPLDRWRPALYRTACRENARIHIFLDSARRTNRGPSCGTHPDIADQLVYLVWVDPDSIGPAMPAPSVRAVRSGTDLVHYAAAHRPSAGARCTRTKH